MSTIFSIIRISLSIILISLIVFSFIIGICIFCKMFNDAIKKIKARDYKSAFLYICGLIIIICAFICCVLLIVMYFSNIDLNC
ncbi:hypothetical protein DMB95_09390 [Campylobacter sp. MIT 12-8780]|nr:hypothetical protein CQA38_08410 [Campylobacter sp. MIT 12-5580]TQR39992.1 hypothetical protein DMB95_09390 [Campylobacter sp. MIT 12-8780]